MQEWQSYIFPIFAFIMGSLIIFISFFGVYQYMKSRRKYPESVRWQPYQEAVMALKSISEELKRLNNILEKK